MGNPTLYQSLHGDYGRATSSDNYGMYQMGTIVSGFLSKFRMFIPPGATQIFLNIYENELKTCSIRHKIPPTILKGYSSDYSSQTRTLDEFIAAEQYVNKCGDHVITIINDGYATGIPITKAGWLYVFVSGLEPSHYNHSSVILVNTEIYNDWYYKTNWQTDVEDVKEYKFKWNAVTPPPKPDGCTSITGYYPRAPTDRKVLDSDGVWRGKYDEYYTFGNPYEYMYTYYPYIRGFIPPGTVVLDLMVIDNGEKIAVTRHRKPPTDSSPPLSPGNEHGLGEFEDKDTWTTFTAQSYLYISHSSFYPLVASRAGWLYTKFYDGDCVTTFWDCQFTVKVDVAIYNTWWDKYIKNAATWQALIEDVETYVPPAQPVAGITVEPTRSAVTKTAGQTSFKLTFS